MSDIERDEMPVDVLFVGAGPASLSGAIRLADLVKEHDARVASGEEQGRAFGDEFSIAVIEKAPYVGAHSLSGAVMNPRGLDELIPAWRDEAPFESKVNGEEVLELLPDGRAKNAFPFGIIPPPMRNHENYIVSLNKLVKWLGEKAEEREVMLLPEFPGRSLLYAEDGKTVRGVRTGDKGIDKSGAAKPRFEAGADIEARVTVLGEGVRGSLAKELIAKLGLEGTNPQVYATGVKELWEVPEGRLTKGKVVHTTGFPLANDEYGGTFIYHLSATQVVIGLVVSLDVADPNLDPHAKLQALKTHDYVRKIIEGGKLVGYGAKALPEGGYYSIPKLASDGVLLTGDTASFLNTQNLKGIHYAIKSGICAAEAIFDALTKEAEPGEGPLRHEAIDDYRRRIEESFIQEELYASRNFRQCFSDGFAKGKIRAGMKFVFGQGSSALPMTADHEHMSKLDGAPATEAIKPEFDGKLTFDKLSDVYFSGTQHEEDQPCHLVISDEDVTNICNDRCTKEYGNPCQHFCPAQVYEMVTAKLNINFANCVHCKTCDIRDPYQVINWVTPEGGGGPVYTGL